jgi:hypothetical protein
MATLTLLNMGELGRMVLVEEPAKTDTVVLESEPFSEGGRCKQDNALDAPRVDAQSATIQDCSKCRLDSILFQ